MKDFAYLLSGIILCFATVILAMAKAISPDCSKDWLDAMREAIQDAPQ